MNSIDELESKLKELSGGAEDRTVIVRADRKLNYGDVIRIMGIYREAKIRDIGVTIR
ncbi:MAG: biopolymer transporter ExbD [Nitrospinae bacterium]|nr:biopolymer transporter ExbD [Nitrospinota bacterium]